MRVTEKGQVTIPKDIRDRLRIRPGSDVHFVPDGTGARLIVVDGEPDFEAWLKAQSGMLDTGGMSSAEFVDWLRGSRDDLGAD